MNDAARPFVTSRMLSLLASALIAAAAWVPLAQPEPVLVAPSPGPGLGALTDVIAHDGGFAALRRSTSGWDLLTSADGFAWTATTITGEFARPDAPVALASATGGLLAFEVTPAVAMWRSSDGLRWERTDLGNPWPVAPGLRIDTTGIDARHVGDLIHVQAGINARADWEALLGVPDHLVVPVVNGQAFHLRVTSGDREGTYSLRLTPAERAVVLRVSDAAGEVVGEQRLAPVADPDEFIRLFIACGGFSPMQERWWFGSDGSPTEPPEWLANLGGYPMVAAGREATLRLDEYGRVLRLDGSGGWERDTAPTSLVHSVLATGGRVLLVGEEPATGLTVWEDQADGWLRLPTPAVDGHWLAAAAPTRGGAVLLYDTDGPPQVTAVVVGRGGRARTVRLDLPDSVWGITVQGGIAVVSTTRSNGDSALWAWALELPDPPPLTPR